MAETNSINYEQITYPNFVHAQTHPNRLAVMARAYGLKTAPVENCRVLEVGCGSGTNLLAMAANLPASEFVGIDLSENHINFGRQAAAEIGTKNLNLICADLSKVDFKDFGEFDYIIAHGFFSWIPPVVREKLLEICRENLAPSGVAFISYNAFPGCHLRLMMREMMMYHTGRIASPSEKVSQAVGLLGFLKDSAFEKQVYGKILEHEYEKTAERRAELIIHDDLGDFNQPFYFHEFMSQAEKYGLQFLSEAEYFSDKYTSFPREVVNVLDQFGETEFIRREQFFDFLKNRRFRQTLVCRDDLKIERKVTDDFFDELRIVCDLLAESAAPDFAPQTIEKFEKPGKEGVTIDHSLTKAALFHLCEVFPQSVLFSDLVEIAKNIVKSQFEDFEFGENDEDILKDVLLKIYASELVGFFLYEPAIAVQASEKPKTDDFVHWQALNSETLFTRRFRTKKIEDDFVRNLMILTDGGHTREQILEDFKEKILSGQLAPDLDETEKQKLIENLPETIENQLRQAAKLALFVS